jgi:hypothetical protein
LAQIFAGFFTLYFVVRVPFVGRFGALRKGRQNAAAAAKVKQLKVKRLLHTFTNLKLTYLSNPR